MPESVEVELLVRSLRKEWVGKRWGGACFDHPSLTVCAWPKDILSDWVVGNVQRKGKYILVDIFDSTRLLGTVVIHLGMSGFIDCAHKFLAENPLQDSPDLSFSLKSIRGRYLVGGVGYSIYDSRCFSRHWWFPRESTSGVGSAVLVRELIGKQGPDVLNDRNMIHVLPHVTMTLENTKQKVHSVLLSPRCVAGVGNILASCGLYHAGVNPFAPASSVVGKAEKIIQGLWWAADQAMEKRNYSWWEVFRRAGKPCFCCGTTIVRGVIGGRGIYHCPNCQR